MVERHRLAISLYLVWTFETAMQRDLYARCFSKLTNQTLFFHSNKFGGSLVSQTNKLVGAVESFWDTIIWSVLPLVISLVGSIIVLSTLLWQYALFLLIFSIVFSIVVYYGSKPMAKLTKKEAKSSNKLNGQLADVISNVLAVKVVWRRSYGTEIFHKNRQFLARFKPRRNARILKSQHYIFVNQHGYQNWSNRLRSVRSSE